MILWCVKCREFRKKGTPDWHECRYSSRHTLVPGHERMEKETAAGKGEDLILRQAQGRGPQEARRAGGSQERRVRQRRREGAPVAAVADGMISGHAYVERDPGGAFFWVKDGGTWDLFRHDDSMVADLIQAEYFRKYGVVVQTIT